MSIALRVLFGLALILSAGLAHAQDQRFTHTGVQADAKRYETYLKGNWQPKGNAALRPPPPADRVRPHPTAAPACSASSPR